MGANHTIQRMRASRLGHSSSALGGWLAPLMVVVMRRGRVFAIGAAILVMGLLALICFGKTESGAPALSILGVQPAGAFEDNGEELQFVTLVISEPRHLRPGAERQLFVKDAGRPIEAKVGDRWISVDTKLWNRCEVWPGFQREMLISVPARTTSCRLRLQYTRAILSEERSVWLARRLPTWMPFHPRLWNWLRRSPYTPSTSWREIIIEVPLPAESERGIKMSDRAHNKRAPVDAGLGVLLAIAAHSSGTTEHTRSAE